MPPRPALPASPTTERLPLPPDAALDPDQRAAAQALVAGPRRGIYGPFVPLLRTPALLERVGALGEALRFGGRLDARLREWTICIVARRLGNDFEWRMHAPLARQAGVAAAAVEALRQGGRPAGLATDEQLMLDFGDQLLAHHGVDDATWRRAVARLGEAGAVELATLVGYFAMVCWVMNVARTPAGAGDEPLLPPQPAGPVSAAPAPRD